MDVLLSPENWAKLQEGLQVGGTVARADHNTTVREGDHVLATCGQVLTANATVVSSSARGNRLYCVIKPRD